jgi:hypothetical protein
MIDVEALAREAKTLYATTDIRPTSKVFSMDPYELRRFAAAVLEEAARVCDLLAEERRGRVDGGGPQAEMAERIRALKPS